jgi:hypothetical protein
VCRRDGWLHISISAGPGYISRAGEAQDDGLAGGGGVTQDDGLAGGGWGVGGCPGGGGRESATGFPGDGEGGEESQKCQLIFQYNKLLAVSRMVHVEGLSIRRCGG